MARILTVTSGLASIVYSSVELARRLAVAGHRVTFAGLPDARRLAEHQGFGFVPLAPSRYQEFLEVDSSASMLERLRDLRGRRRRARQSMGVDGFAQVVRDLAPDLVLINGEMHEHILAASSTGVPLVLLNSFVSIWRSPGLPPPHHLARPGVGWQGTRAGAWLLWVVLRLRKWWGAMSRRARRLGCDRLSILGALAREAGFDLRRETDDSQWLIPFTYRRLPVLSLHALEFEFPHSPPGRVRYVGPMVLESRIDRPMTEGERAKLDAVLEQRRRAPGERKLVFAGFGSVFTTHLALLRRLLGVVAERPCWDLVVSLSGQVSPAELGPLPERVHVFSWVPQTSVLRHADVMVTHGGVGTIDECVLNCVPTLVYCGFETDMGGTTARVVHHGIGIAGSREQDGTPVIRGYLDQLLREPRFRENLERLRRCYAAYAEDRVAERAVEALLARGRGGRRSEGSGASRGTS